MYRVCERESFFSPLLVQNAFVKRLTDHTIQVGVEAFQRSYFIFDALNSPSESVAEVVYLVENLVRTV